jgi:hypothetical protein
VITSTHGAGVELGDARPTNCSRASTRAAKGYVCIRSWLPATEAECLAWALRGTLVLELLVLVASVVDKTALD